MAYAADTLAIIDAADTKCVRLFDPLTAKQLGAIGYPVPFPTGPTVGLLPIPALVGRLACTTLVLGGRNRPSINASFGFRFSVLGPWF